MFARNFLNTLFGNNKSLMITRSQLKNQILSCRFLSNEVVVKHDPEAQLIYVDVDTKRAYVKYKQNGKLMKLLTTEVPEELGGKGLGKILAHATFTYIADNNLRMEIKCHFLQHYLDKYGEQFKEYLHN